MPNAKRQLAAGSFATAAVIVLAACGGGGDSGAPAAQQPQAVTKAEGVYEGTITGPEGNSAFDLLVLENNELWGLGGDRIGGTLFVDGLIQGQATAGDGTLSTTNARVFDTDGAANVNLNANFVANTSINGTITAPGISLSFAGQRLVGTYDYNTPAELTSIVGNWNVTSLDGTPAALTIAQTGALNASASGCVLTGSIVPRPSGKNVFNVSLTFGPAPCALPGQTGTGVAVSAPVQGTALRQLIIVGLNSDRTVGLALVGAR